MTRNIISGVITFTYEEYNNCSSFMKLIIDLAAAEKINFDIQKLNALAGKKPKL